MKRSLLVEILNRIKKTAVNRVAVLGRFFSNMKHKKLILLGLTPMVLVLLLAPQVANANLFDFLIEFTYGFMAKIFYGFSYIISAIIGIGIAVEAWVIEVILNMNTQIINSPPVKFGFPVALSITNLGFTAAIIVIAIATILRWSGYGIKQILWKLIVAALLVNFSLVFAGAILNFADQLTLYFLNQVNPAGSGSSFNAFASGLAGAFNPQKNQQFDPRKDPKNLTSDELEKTAGVGGGADIGKLILPITSLVYTIFSLAAIVITLGVLIAMLLYRYVAIGILLILMPFAWLLWIFPGLSSNWSKWWNQFLKQVFFAPLVVFFLYLGILTNGAMSSGQNASINITAYASNSNPTWAAISEFFTDLFSPIIENTMRQIVVLGIMIGGLYAANQLSIFGAKAGMTAMKGFSGKMGNLGKRGSSWVLRRKGTKPGAESVAEKMQRKVSTMEPTGVMGKLGKYALGWGVRGTTRLAVAGGEEQVKQKEKEVGGKATADLKAMHLTAMGPMKIAIEKEFTKRQELGGVSIHSTLTDKNKKLYASYGQSKDFENLEKASTMNVEMANLIRSGAEKDNLDEAARRFYNTFEKKDAALMHVADVFSGKAKMGLDEKTLERVSKSVAHGIAVSAPMLTPNVVPKMKSASLKQFSNIYKAELETELTGISINLSEINRNIEDLRKLPDREENRRIMNEFEKSRDDFVKIQRNTKKVLDNFENVLYRNATGLGGMRGGEAKAPSREEEEEEKT